MEDAEASKDSTTVSTDPTPKPVVPCPRCRVQHSSPDAGVWPFCSERCKLIDLGKWAQEEYRVVGEDVSNEKQVENED